MRRHLFSIALVGLVALAPGCGGSSSGGSGGGTTFDNVGAATNSGGTAAVLADTSGNVMTIQDGSVVFRAAASGGDITLYYGSDGYPTRMVTSGYVLCFSGWDTTNNTVNLGIVFPDGTTKTEHGVAVDAAVMSRLTSLIGSNPAASQGAALALLAGSDAAKVWGITTSDLAWAAGYAGTLLSAAGCGAAIGTAIASAGASVPVVALACASTALTFATELEIIDTNNTALVATGTALTAIDAVSCAGMDAAACAGLVLTAAETVLSSADTTVEGLQSEVEIVEMGLPYGGGAVQVTLEWKRGVDIDLYVTDPGSETIWYGDTQSASGGYLDHDDIDGGTSASPARENIFWESNAPAGSYSWKVKYFSTKSESGATDWSVAVFVNGSLVDSKSGTLSSVGAESSTFPFTVQ